jgi:hypothetical protein
LDARTSDEEVVKGIWHKILGIMLRQNAAEATIVTLSIVGYPPKEHPFTSL